jgi:hypothetical protein
VAKVHFEEILFVKNYVILVVLCFIMYHILYMYVFIAFAGNMYSILYAPMSHCKEISIYVFPEKELCGLSPNCHIHVSVSDLYVYSHDRSTSFQQNMLTYCKNI